MHVCVIIFHFHFLGTTPKKNFSDHLIIIFIFFTIVFLLFANFTPTSIKIQNQQKVMHAHHTHHTHHTHPHRQSRSRRTRKQQQRFKKSSRVCSCPLCVEVHATRRNLIRKMIVLFPCSRTTYCGGWPACCCCKYCSSANLMPHLVIFFMYLPTHKSKQVSSFEFRVLARNDVTHLLKHISAISLYRRSMSCICSVSISLTSASCPLMLYYFDDGWRRDWIGKHKRRTRPQNFCC